MKPILRYFNIFCSLILFSLFLGSCNSDSPKGIDDSNNFNTQNNTVPELLDRSEKTRMGKEWDGVQSAYQSNKLALLSDETNIKSRMMLSQIFIKEARVTGEHGHYYPAALGLLNEVLDAKDLDGDNKFIALMNKSGVLLSLHEFDKALATGLEAVKLNSNNSQIHGVLVDAYVELGEYEKALAIADRMMQLRPDLRSYSRVSYLREIHGDTEGAYQAMKMAAEAGYPGTEETAWTMLTLGELFSQYGEIEKAESVFNQILQMRPNYPFAVAALADLDIKKGDIEMAEEKLNRAASIIPEVGFYVSLAHIYKEQNRTEELNSITQEIFVMLQDDVDHGHNMNLEYSDIYSDLLDNTEEALRYIKMEYDKRPKNIDVNRMMAKVLYDMDQHDESKVYAMAASVTDSKHPDLVKLNSLLN